MTETLTFTRRSYTQTTLKSSSSTALRKPSTKTKVNPPTKVDTDVILCIKPEFAQLIKEKAKNHEYRKYKLRDTVKRLWLYETAPVSAITCVIETSRPRAPGEVQDPSGVGNDDFDAGKKQSKYGYPIRALWSLNKPVKMDALRTRFGIKPPQGFMFATEQLLREEPLAEMEKVF